MFGMGLFLGNLLWYSGLFVVLVGVAVAGVMVGKKLRANKDAKNSTANQAGEN